MITNWCETDVLYIYYQNNQLTTTYNWLTDVYNQPQSVVTTKHHMLLMIVCKKKTGLHASREAEIDS